MLIYSKAKIRIKKKTSVAKERDNKNSMEREER